MGTPARHVRLAVHSDFHVDSPLHGPGFSHRFPEADVVVVSGDIAPPCQRLLEQGRHGILAWLRRQAGPNVPIVFVMGNNDYVNFPYEQIIEALRKEAIEHDICFLHNQSAMIQGIEFIGSPLFVNGKLPGLGPSAISRAMEEKFSAFPPTKITDNFCICGQRPICISPGWIPGTKDANGRVLGWPWFIEEHQKAVAFIDRALSGPAMHPRIVVSHWAPSLRSIPPDSLPLHPRHAYWASNQEHLVERAHAWIHGHVHAATRYRVGQDRNLGLVLANCHGTPAPGFGNPHYSHEGVLEVEWLPGMDPDVRMRWDGFTCD